MCLHESHGACWRGMTHALTQFTAWLMTNKTSDPFSCAFRPNFAIASTSWLLNPKSLS